MQRILKAKFCFHLSLVAKHPMSHHAATPVPGNTKPGTFKHSCGEQHQKGSPRCV